MIILPGAHLIGYKATFPKLGPNNFLASGAQIIGDVVSGTDCSYWFNTVTRGDCNYIRIGNRVNIQDGTVIHVTNKLFPTFIEDDVSIGHNATIHGCKIEEGSLIGMGATLLDGCIIGKKTLVAAGSLVPPGKTFPGGILLKGSPAKPARDLTEKELEILTRTTKYYLEYKSYYDKENVMTHQYDQTILANSPDKP